MGADRQTLGFSSPRFARAAVRRLREALTTGDPGTVLEAGALASAVVEREVDADAAARRLGYSAAHVSTLVRRLTGKPFRVVRQEMRLARARWHLERGASVKTAAFESGFNDPAYMSRVFARCHGMPPSRWRGTRREG